MNELSPSSKSTEMGCLCLKEGVTINVHGASWSGGDENVLQSIEVELHNSVAILKMSELCTLNELNSRLLYLCKAIINL